MFQHSRTGQEGNDQRLVVYVGEEGEVIGISEMCRGQQRRRLLDLGVVPGTKIKVELESLGGDPSGYSIRGAVIAIRKINAAQIYINQN